MAGSPGETIRELDQRGAAAVLALDFNELDRIYAAGFLLHAPNNTIMTRQEVLDAMRNPRFSYTSFERNVKHVFVDGEIAVSLGGEIMTPVGDHPGADREIHRRYTHVWRREGGSWKLLVRHTNVVRAP